ncbi:MAG TPA: VCBS repeat-containing protein, partial [Gemmatimonadaceae bacterium]|nr:VCBS repeat-containing protein [Gemmatimonadaceae bacterium]
CDRATRPPQPRLFDLLTQQQTGISFSNNLPEKPDFNILNYLYYYNGAGVAIGDVDNDGLPDLYFTSNLGSNKLYRNLGNYRFEDITNRAGVADSVGWKTGVTMADVNGDGKIDIYVSGVDYLKEHGRNVLYINNGDGTFTDRTQQFGLDHHGFSTQALFFDYDGDGDLDMYLLDHSTHKRREIEARSPGITAKSGIGDRLFRNDGGHFTDVTGIVGIHDNVDGYGLGVVASDFNDDGCTDLYVTNDFQGDDYLYINNCNGSFTESIARATGHTSRFSMGVDAADLNNDGRPDIVSLDMMPEREDILKRTSTLEGWDIYNRRLQAGYHPQFARNMLQLNCGDGRFCETGLYAGIFDTDWSWAALLADLDNDGEKDLFVTNGVYRRPNDMDYIDYVSQEAVQRSLGDTITEANLKLLQKMPSVPLANYAFHNNGNLTFTNVAEAWGLATPGFSNGAAYVDLNNSGSLDLVVNNINAPASIYRNNANAMYGNSYLTVVLKGSGGNTQGIGAKVIAKVGAITQLVEQQPTRGFESSVDPRLHFGLDKAAKIDSLTIIWPDKRYQVLTSVDVNRILTISQAGASGKWSSASRFPRPASRVFADVTDQVGAKFKHEEDTFFDYSREPLIPHLLSREGPRLAVGDVNGDGLDDFYVGGAKSQAGQIFVQQRNGSFRASTQPSITADRLAEDVGAAFFDANGDGALDLIVVSGGNEFSGSDEALRPRLYLNDGHGNFTRTRTALPDIFENASCVAVGDFNRDGHPDLFLGSRLVGHSYGLIPRSHLLQNNGAGQFTDVTDQIAPQLGEAGMVTSATWVDYDHDGKLDLVVVGQWMPVRAFHQENGKLVDRTKEAGLSNTNGWWNSVDAIDLRANGRQDLVLGNLGTNSYMKASAKEPAKLYVGDFSHTGGGNVEQILTFYHDGVSYPLVGRAELLGRIPALRGRYPSYRSFGASRIEDIFPASDLRQAQVREADTFESVIALNNGNGTFTLAPLPREAQYAPIYATVAGDFDGDGKTDLVVAGNLFDVTPMLGRYDASKGLLLRGDGEGHFMAVDEQQSGLAIDGQVRDMKLLHDAAGRPLIGLARNNDELRIIRARGTPGVTRPSPKSPNVKPTASMIWRGRSAPTADARAPRVQAEDGRYVR